MGNNEVEEMQMREEKDILENENKKGHEGKKIGQII